MSNIKPKNIIVRDLYDDTVERPENLIMNLNSAYESGFVSGSCNDDLMNYIIPKSTMHQKFEFIEKSLSDNAALLKGIELQLEKLVNPYQYKEPEPEPLTPEEEKINEERDKKWELSEYQGDIKRIVIELIRKGQLIFTGHQESDKLLIKNLIIVAQLLDKQISEIQKL